MYGFITRARQAGYGDASRKQPRSLTTRPSTPRWHTPRSTRLVVPRADTPRVGASTWTGFAELCQLSNRTEIVGWKSSL